MKNPENNPMDVTADAAAISDSSISLRRLQAFCDASGFDDSDVIMSHSIRSEDLSVKGTVDLVFGDILTLISACRNIEKDMIEFTDFHNECADENARLRGALDGALKEYVQLAASGDCGNWDPEEEPHVIKAREALKGGA
ncbi:hypothetical protein [Thalassospira lohafexi]|uniref:Uncharacterized protein n=1 Tax=Thalassospira lohafexi TaxID=744227 RepID=A0A2N3L0L7_9PROT|nr:hypothetical protein [Thalassospira lohafexi]PKR56362.1 hypothetical protein COO92_21390 [Thalassospira lohafexi]